MPVLYSLACRLLWRLWDARRCPPSVSIVPLTFRCRARTGRCALRGEGALPIPLAPGISWDLRPRREGGRSTTCGGGALAAPRLLCSTAAVQICL